MEIAIIILWIVSMLAIASIAAVLAKNFGVEFLIGMYAAAIVITAVIGGKVVEFGPFVTSAAVIVFSITFFLIDTISEFFGKEAAKKAVWIGFLADILLLFAIWVAVSWDPAPGWNGQEAFAQTLGTTWRVALASVVAYVVSQNHDVWAFHFLKEKTNGRHLWLRNNLSTGVSQTIDSVLFISIAFFGLFPIVPLIIGNVAVKMIIAAIDTPFLYLMRFYYVESEVR
jgi:queuosine precursor transporter